VAAVPNFSTSLINSTSPENHICVSKRLPDAKLILRNQLPPKTRTKTNFYDIQAQNRTKNHPAKYIICVKILTENTKEIEPSDDKSVLIPKH
jgi:hypothetical protein